MNTFEEEFGRSPTQEDFKIQAHTLESLIYTLDTELDFKTEKAIKRIIERLKE